MAGGNENDTLAMAGVGAVPVADGKEDDAFAMARGGGGQIVETAARTTITSSDLEPIPSSLAQGMAGDIPADGEQTAHDAQTTGPSNLETMADEAPEQEVADKFVPQVGMAFESEDKAYEMYNTYAGNVGFSIRKSDTKRRGDDSIYLKYMVCSNQGHSKGESSKGTTRTGCNARAQFSVSKEGVWTVQKVVPVHNHYLASPNKRQKLRSQRTKLGRAG